MGLIGILGGSGLTALEGLQITASQQIETPYGQPSAPLELGTFTGQPIVFLARHGKNHHLPPHLVNYRANIAALQSAGVTDILAINAVGGISASLAPGTLMVPDQIVDYTWGREFTFSDVGDVRHVDFTWPYTQALRQRLLLAGKAAGLVVQDGGVYAATQGPRLESAAEINRLERDGCAIVGMTGMPEAALAREAGLHYACLALVVNMAAGRGEGVITMAGIDRCLQQGMQNVRQLLQAFLM